MIFTGASADEVWPLVRDFHYSKRMPSNIQTGEYIFSWRQPGGLLGDNGDVLAAAIFGFPSAGYAVGPNGKAILELQRLVRIPSLRNPLSKLVSLSIKWLRQRTGFAGIISYADPNKGHTGTIYQAANFIYVGQSKEKRQGFLLPTGEVIHRTTARKLVGGAKSDGDVKRARPNWVSITGDGKHLYVYPLRQRPNAFLQRFNWIEKPYPKPIAARLVDAPVPTGVSQEHTLGAAPISSDA
jgi:hypothetical protein